jgi:hypothetical protein
VHPLPVIVRAWWRPALGVAWLLAIAFLTLQPAGVQVEHLATIPKLCLFCGTRGAGDAVLNVVMFVPLGLVLGGRSRSLGRMMLVGAALSTGIELVQLFVPGRSSSPADVLWNGLGAGLGGLVHAWIAARASGRARAGALPWLAALLVTLPVLGVLATPAPTEDDYWGQWAPNLGHMPQYSGAVLEADLDGAPLLSGRVPGPGPHRPLLAGGWNLTSQIQAGPPPRSVSPIVSIYDGQQREILLVGAHRDDLVFRERRLAHVLRLEAPDVRVPAALASLHAGDRVALGARRADGVFCLRLDTTEWCGLGITPGRTWGYLLYLEGPREWFRRLLDSVWLAMLFFPIGLFASTRREAMIAGAVGVAALIATVAFTPLVAGTPIGLVLECLAGVTGVAAGWAGLAFLRGVADAGQAGVPDSISASH